MTPEQEAQLRVLASKAAPALKRVTELKAARQALEAQKAAAERERNNVLQERVSVLSGLGCELEATDGDTIIRTRSPLGNEPPLDQMPDRELMVRLRERSANCEQIFAGSSGGFSWRWTEA